MRSGRGSTARSSTTPARSRSQRSDLNLRNLERDYGFGFRFNTDNGVVVRLDAGFGSSDGKHLYITFGGVF